VGVAAGLDCNGVGPYITTVFSSNEVSLMNTKRKIFAGELFAGNDSQIKQLIKADGISLSRLEYPKLYGNIKEIYGSADAGSFNIPSIDVSGVNVKQWFIATDDFEVGYQNQGH